MTERRSLSGSRLHIGRYRAHYLISSTHPAPERVKATLDESISNGLSRTLGALLSGPVIDAHTGVWFIRRLHIDLDADVTWERDALQRALGAQVARVLVETIRHGADGQNVVWFPDRSAYLASFLAERADGRGAQWYYESFAGLRPLAVSAALRTTVCDVPQTGLAALRHLGPDALRRVLAALTVQDAWQVLEVFAGDAPASDPTCCLETAWDAWKGLLQTPLDAADVRNALRLYLASSTDDVAGPPLRAAAFALVCLTRRLESASPEEGARILSAIAEDDCAALYLAAGPADADALTPLRAAPPEWLREIGQVLLARGQTAVTAVPAAPGPIHTPFGGAFLLLPLLAELPVDEATAGWPDANDTSAATLARFLMLIKYCGSTQAAAAFRDPLLRNLLRIAPNVSTETLGAWQARLTVAHRHRFLETLEAWHAGRGLVRLEAQFLVRGGTADRPVAVLIDGARGVWRWIGRYPRGGSAQLAHRFRAFLARVRPGSLLLCDPKFLEPLRAACPDQHVITRGDHIPEEGTEVATAVRELLSRLDYLSDDLEFLALPPALGVRDALDRTFSVAAQGLLRSFAWKLPGFGRAHLSYLFGNFLDFPASLEDQPARRVVSLGRPPLDLVLNMTGLNRGAYRLGWLDEKPLALFPGQ
jgi:hypothetical protein